MIYEWQHCTCVCVYLVIRPDVSGENGEVVKAKRHVVVHILVQPLMSWAGVTMATHRLTKIVRQRHTSQVQGNCCAREGFTLTVAHVGLSQTDLHVNKGCVTPSGWTTRTWWRQLVSSLQMEAILNRKRLACFFLLDKRVLFTEMKIRWFFKKGQCVHCEEQKLSYTPQLWVATLKPTRRGYCTWACLSVSVSPSRNSGIPAHFHCKTQYQSS